jgi:cytochrome c553
MFQNVTLLLLVSTIAFAGCFKKHTTKNVIVSSSSAIIETYVQNCAGCHGEKMEAFVDRK